MSKFSKYVAINREEYNNIIREQDERVAAGMNVWVGRINPFKQSYQLYPLPLVKTVTHMQLPDGIEYNCISYHPHGYVQSAFLTQPLPTMASNEAVALASWHVSKCYASIPGTEVTDFDTGKYTALTCIVKPSPLRLEPGFNFRGYVRTSMGLVTNGRRVFSPDITEFVDYNFSINAQDDLTGVTWINAVGVRTEEDYLDHLCTHFSTTPEHVASHLSQEAVCHTCMKAVDTLKCSRCRKAFYCSRECQLENWSDHKLVCKQ